MSDEFGPKLRIQIHHQQKIALLQELIDEFLPPSAYEIVPEYQPAEADVLQINLSGSQDLNAVKREIFQALAGITGHQPGWGILTGVRPVKLAGEMQTGGMSRAEAARCLTDQYFLTKEKTDLLLDIFDLQMHCAGIAPADSCSVYIGIPFCPTRCVYCSFASNQVPPEEIERYLPALLKEIAYAGRKLTETGQKIESVYIGGGTPTTLTAAQMDVLLEAVRKHMDLSSSREFCVEAGRPDTVTEEKLHVLKDHGVDRISINPQSMKQKTLDLIGRSHTPEDIEEAFAIAHRVGFRVINADLIAGLPEEAPEDFAETLRRVLELGANNITTHTLAVKRASRLIGIDRDYHYKAADRVTEMLKMSQERLAEAGFAPYYLYRQKHMAGNHENTGYALPGTECLYNIRIMDEHQSNLALGAGGISKKYYPAENRLVRTPNVTNYQEYISRIDEMCERKERGYFHGN